MNKQNIETPIHKSNLEHVFPGKSELAKLMRAFDWSKTELPPVKDWPGELRHTIRLCLMSKTPMAIYWGPNYITFYNDAYLAFFDETQHPSSLGKPGSECWPHIWGIIEPLFNHVRDNAEAATIKDIHEYGYVRCHFSPILSNDGHTVNGILHMGSGVSTDAAGDAILAPDLSESELITQIKSLPQLNTQRSELISEFTAVSYLHTIATRNVQDEDISSFLLEMIDTALSITHASKAALQLTDEKTRTLKIVASSGFSPSFIDYYTSVPIGIGMSGAAFESNQRVIVGDISRSPIFKDKPFLEPLLNEGVRAAQSTPIRSRSGKILGILSTHYEQTHPALHSDLPFIDLLARLIADILEKTQWMQERATLIGLLQEADRRKNNFLAMLSHELRNPLASISNSSFLLSQTETGSDIAKQAKATIERQIAQITRLIDDLLDVTRITQNKIQLQRQQIDINKLICTVVDENHQNFVRLGITLQTQLAAEPVMITADPLRIEQIINNLLNNAAKFTPQGGTAKINVEMDKQKQQAVICVSDNGIGIEPELLQHLFKPFMQADCSLERNKDGLGLGLALVKDFVEMHGGHVEAFSNGKDQGSRIVVRLPLAQAIDDKIVLSPINKSKSKANRSVLIIEDNLYVADSLRMVIEMFGHTVHMASTGAEGVEKARAIKPDFVFCDIGLPGVDGYDIAKALKADPSLEKTYLVALSGYALAADIKKAREAGFDIHLAKPPNLAMVQELLLEQ